MCELGVLTRRSWWRNHSPAGVNPAPEQVFQKRAAPLVVDATGSVKLMVSPEELYTITTLKTGAKGVAPKPSPPSKPFPLPFTQV